MANMANTAAYRLSDGRMAVDVDSAKALTADDCGFVQKVIADAVTITLPSVGAGLNYTFLNGGAKVTNGPVGTGSNGSVALTVSPAAADKIQGGVGGTATANKDLVNTKATSRAGLDELSIVGGATTAWSVTSIKGVWAREA